MYIYIYTLLLEYISSCYFCFFVVEHLGTLGWGFGWQMPCASIADVSGPLEKLPKIWAQSITAKVWSVVLFMSQILLNLIHLDTSWYILIHLDTSWYILIHLDTSWYILIHVDNLIAWQNASNPFFDLLKSVAGYESHYATFRWNPLNTMSCNFTMNERVESAFYNNTERQSVFLMAVNSGAASCVMTNLWQTVLRIKCPRRRSFRGQNITMYVEGNFSDPTEALCLTMSRHVAPQITFSWLCRHSKSPAALIATSLYVIVITNLMNSFHNRSYDHIFKVLGCIRVPVPQKVKTLEFGLLPEGFLVFTGQDAFLQTLAGKVAYCFDLLWVELKRDFLRRVNFRNVPVIPARMQSFVFFSPDSKVGTQGSSSTPCANSSFQISCSNNVTSAGGWEAGAARWNLLKDIKNC